MIWMPSECHHFPIRSALAIMLDRRIRLRRLAFLPSLCYVCPMAKIILLAVIFFFAYSIIKKRAPKKPDHRRGEYMVRCAHCGIHQPGSESIASGDLFYCCEAHRRLHER